MTVDYVDYWLTDWSLRLARELGSGCYAIMRIGFRRPLYIGQAGHIGTRIAEHLRGEGMDAPPELQDEMMREPEDFKVRVWHCGGERIELEGQLIHRHRPLYNKRKERKR